METQAFVELRTPTVFNQKLDYIHNNPVKAGLCINPEDYHYLLQDLNMMESIALKC